MNIHVSLVVLLLLVLVSCKKKQLVDDTILARVEQDYLYLSDIKHILPEQLKGKDSLDFVESYIQKWVRNKLLYVKAAENLSENQEEIEEKTEKFRQSLYVYKYEQMLVTQKLDQNVTETDIDNYYNNHRNEFVLKETIIKPYFVQASKKAGQITDLISLMYSRREEDVEKIKEFCYKNSSKFYFAEEWVSENEISSLLPAKNHDLKRLFFSKQVLKDQDSLSFFVVRVDELMTKGEIAPKEYVINEIRQILLQRRTQELLKSIRNKIQVDALKNNVFEIYNK